jgi:hypothetical protein
LITPGYWAGAAVATYGVAAWVEAGGSFQMFYTAAAMAAILWAGLGAVLTRPTPQAPPPRPSGTDPGVPLSCGHASANLGVRSYGETSLKRICYNASVRA